MDKMIEFYAKRIYAGKTTLDKVPDVIRDKVQDLLRILYPDYLVI